MEKRWLVEQGRKLWRECERSRLRRTETKRSERASKRRTTVQSGGTRGARKAVVCRGPPHWHTVIRYDSHRPLTRTGPHSHQRSHNTTSASAVRTSGVTFDSETDWPAPQEALTWSNANLVYFKKRKKERTVREGGCRVPADRIVVGRARSKGTHRQFYSPSYYLSLLHRNGLTIIACFHSRDHQFMLCL